MTDNPNKVIEIAVNLDDVTGEVIGHVTQSLLEAGALDVWTVPLMMKKHRPGAGLHLLCQPQDQQALTEKLIALTGSFGVRYQPWQRTTLDRKHVEVNTRFGTLRLKVGSLNGKPIVAKPEYDDALTLATSQGVELRLVMLAGQAAADAWLSEQ